MGRDALEGKTKPPAGCSPLEFAVFNLLHAIEELSKQTGKPCGLCGKNQPNNLTQ